MHVWELRCLGKHGLGCSACNIRWRPRISLGACSGMVLLKSLNPRNRVQHIRIIVSVLRSYTLLYMCLKLYSSSSHSFSRFLLLFPSLSLLFTHGSEVWGLLNAEPRSQFIDVCFQLFLPINIDDIITSSAISHCPGSVDVPESSPFRLF